MDIVAISKGALVTNWREIMKLQKSQMYEFDTVGNCCGITNT